MFDASTVDLLLVDDDDDYRDSVARRFRRRGFQVQEATSGQQALELFGRRRFDVAIFDMVMPGMSGVELLKHVCESDAQCEVILLTGQGTIETAVEAMRLGAFDYQTKPCPLAELEILIERAYEHGRLRRENENLRAVLRRSEPTWEMVGESPAMQEVYRLIERAGPSDRSILIQGESGTGKELVARALHRHSPRADKPLVTVNCAALPDQLLESELFGHEKGAFTGATSTRPGLFEMADGGTLFVDEIGEMSPPMQVKVLRVLEDGSLRRVGSNQERRVDVRLISATNRDLEEEVEEKRFREDLLYRINVLSIDLPALHDREGDVPLLTARFLGDEWQISPEALQRLEHYHWPGNVRQLINVIERAKILAEGGTIQVGDLPKAVAQDSQSAAQRRIEDVDDLASVQKAKVIEILRREGGNKTRAAKSLGITRRSLYRLIDKFQIDTLADAERA